MEVLGVPADAEELVRLILDEKLTLAGPFKYEYTYLEDRQSLIVRFENKADADKVVRLLPQVEVDENVTCRVQRYLPDSASKAKGALEVSDVSDPDLVLMFFENKVQHPLEHVYDDRHMKMKITFGSEAEADEILSGKKYEIEGHTDVQVCRLRETVKGLLVTGIPPDVSESLLKAYFSASFRSDGGLIKTCHFDAGTGTARLVFEDDDVAIRVAKKGNHVLKNKAVTVSTFAEADAHASPTQPGAPAEEPLDQVPDPLSKTVITLEVHPVNEPDLVLLFFENKVQHQLLHIYDAEHKKMMITFDSTAETDEIVFGEKYEIEGHTDVYVSRLNKTVKGLLVTEIPPDVSESLLKAYFSASFRSDGGPIKTCDFDAATGTARLVFEDGDVAIRVAKKGNHSLKNKAVTVRTFTVADAHALPTKPGAPAEEPRGQVSGILVTGIHPDVSEPILKAHFSARFRSNGGPIKTFDFDSEAGTARLLFEEDDAAARVVSQASHVVKGRALTVKMFAGSIAENLRTKTEASGQIPTRVPKQTATASWTGSPGSSARTVLVRNLPLGKTAPAIQLDMLQKWNLHAGDYRLHYNPSTRSAVVNFRSSKGAETASQKPLYPEADISVCRGDDVDSILGDVSLLIENISLETSREALWCWLKVVVGYFPHTMLYAESLIAAVGLFAYCQDIDIEKATSLADDYRIDDRYLRIKVIRPTSTVQVSGIASNVREAALKQCLESNGGLGIKGCVEHLELREDGHAVVTFKEEGALKQLQSCACSFMGRVLSFCQYYKELGLASPPVQFGPVIAALAAAGKSGEAEPQLIVKGFEGAANETVLLRYLEDRGKSGGGKIKSFSSVGSAATVSFHDREAAQRIVQKFREEGLRLGGCNLTATIKGIMEVKHAVKNKVLLKNIGDASEDSIKYFLMGVSGTPVEHLTFVRLLVDSSICALVCFSGDIDLKRLSAFLQVVTLDAVFVEMEPVEVNPPLLVKNVPENAYKDLLEYAFPHELSSCKQLKPGEWIVTFNDPSDADTVLGTSVLYNGSQELCVTRVAAFETVDNARERGKRGQRHVSLDSVSPLVIDFVFNNRMSNFNSLLKKTGCTFSRGENGCLTVSCALSATDPRYQTIQKQWHNIVQEYHAFFDDYAVHEIPIIPGIWETFSKSELFRKHVVNADTNLTMLLPASQTLNTSPILRFVGSKDPVQVAAREAHATLKDINDRMERDKLVTQHTEEGLSDSFMQLLKACDFEQTIQERWKDVDCKVDVAQCKVCFKGLPIDIQQCADLMKDMLNKSAEETIEWSAAAVQLLHKRKLKDVVQKKLHDAGLSKSAVWWITEQASIRVRGLSEEAVRSTAVAVRAEFKDNHVELAEEAADLMASKKWKQFLEQTYAKWEDNIVIMNKDRSLLVACQACHSDMLLEEVNAFLRSNVVKKDFMSIQSGLMKLLSGTLKAELNKLEQAQAHNHVKLQHILGDTGRFGFAIEGNVDGLANMKRLIQEIMKKRKIVTKLHSVSAPGAYASLVAGEHDLLKKIGQESETYIDLYDADSDESTADDSSLAEFLHRGVQVSVVKTDITKMDCDVIVNPCNQDLNHMGGLARIIANAGGPSVIEECDAYIKKNGRLSEGNACITASGKLACKRIVHAVGPKWQGGTRNEANKLYMAVQNSLRLAEENDMSSIALPPISSGIFNYPIEKCVQTIVDAVLQHCEDTTKELLRHIYLVDVNDNGVKHFKLALARKLNSGDTAKDEPQPSKATSKTKGTVSVASPLALKVSGVSSPVVTPSLAGGDITLSGGLQVKLFKGDLMKQQVDVIVTSITPDRNLSSGVLSKLILTHGGPGTQQQLNTDYTSNLSFGDVAVTNGYQLGCKYVFYVCCPHWAQGASTDVVRQLVLKCLEEADRRKVSSIALPGIGTGNLNFPLPDVAMHTYSAISTFGSRQSTVKCVKLVMAIDSVLQAFQSQHNLGLSHSAPTGAAQTGSQLLQTSGKNDGDPLCRENCFAYMEDVAKDASGAGMVSSSGNPATGARKLEVNGLTIQLVVGDISEESTAVVVNWTDKSLSLEGQVSRALVRQGGYQITEDCRRKAHIGSEGLFLGSCGSLPCQHVLHVDFNMKIADIVPKCLQKVEDNSLGSISFTAIARGPDAGKPKEVAKCFANAIAEFTKQTQCNYLKLVRFVLMEEGVFQDYHAAMTAALSEKKGFLNKLRSYLPSMPGASVSKASHSPAFSPPGFDEEDENMDPSTVFLVKLVICGSEAKIPDAIQRLDRYCSDNLHSESIRDPGDAIKKLSSAEIRHLKVDGMRHSVKIDVDQHQPEIILKSMDLRALKEMATSSQLMLQGRHITHVNEEQTAKEVQWQYENQSTGEWHDYPLPLNAKVEKAYRSKLITFTYGPAKSRYIVDVIKMKDTSENDKNNEINVRRWDLSSGLPPHWTPGNEYAQVLVNPQSKEYRDVVDAAMSTLPGTKLSVVEVKRVQNPYTYKQYLTQKERVAKTMSASTSLPVERKLWHGTAQETVESICKGGFNRSYCGKNATVYGQGVYFARKASYSLQDTYSVPDGNNEKYLMSCMVLTGEYELGNKDMRVPSKKPGQSVISYDTSVDNVNNPGIFVTYNDNQAYPAYVIRWKCG